MHFTHFTVIQSGQIIGDFTVMELAVNAAEEDLEHAAGNQARAQGRHISGHETDHRVEDGAGRQGFLLRLFAFFQSGPIGRFPRSCGFSAPRHTPPKLPFQR